MPKITLHIMHTPIQYKHMRPSEMKDFGILSQTNFEPSLYGNLGRW